MGRAVFPWWAMTTLIYFWCVLWKSTPPQSFISFTVHPSDLLFPSFNLMAWTKGHWIIHVVLQMVLSSLMHLFFNIEKTGSTELGARQYIDWLSPGPKRNLTSETALPLFHVNFSFRGCFAVVDVNLCSADRLEVTTEWGDASSSTTLIKEKTPQRRFFPRARSLPWYHIQSIHYRGDWQPWFHLHAAASLVSPALTSSIYWLIVLSAQETRRVTWRLQTGKMLVWGVNRTRPGVWFFLLLTETRAIFDNVSARRLFWRCSSKEVSYSLYSF